MPLHAEREAFAGVFERFDGAVLGPGDRNEPLTDLICGLVVVGLDRRNTAQDFFESTSGGDVDGMIAESACRRGRHS
jgi:hypothetical protein